MTTRCPSGGTSVARPGFAANLFVTPAMLGALLNNVKTPWAVGVAAYLGLLTYDLGTYCTTDPPATPTMTAADALALLSLDPVAHAIAVSKWETWVASLVWDQFCECSSGTASPPIAAPAQPAGFPQLGGGTSFVLAMRQYQCKVMDLWTGSTNAAPPTGWDAPGYDDSAWPNAVDFSPTVFGPTIFKEETNGADTTADAPAASPIPYGAEKVAPWNNPSSTASEYLIRWYFPGPAIVPADVVVDLICDVDGAIGSGTFSLNGTTGGALLNTVQLQELTRAIVPGGNVLALWINSGNTSHLPTNSGHDWFSLAMHSDSLDVAGGQDDCCSKLSAQVAQILNSVITLSGVLAPINSLSEGTVHSGLHGGGFVSTTAAVGVFVELTIPASYGRRLGVIDHYFEVGSVWWDVGFGQPAEIPLHQASTFLPAPLLVDGILYQLGDGVTAVITEITRGP